MYEGFRRFEIQTSDQVGVMQHVVRIRPLPCGHYPAERVPDLVYEELHRFLTR